VSSNPDFEAFFASNHESVVRALSLALADRGRAEDGAQEAFAKAYRHWRRVSMMERPVAWVYVVALNGARRELKRDLAAPSPDLSVSAPDLAGTVTAQMSVREALAALAPRQRVAIVLRYLADLQVAEVASAMGCSVGTAKATLHTALARLRVQLEPETDDEASDTGAATPRPRDLPVVSPAGHPGPREVWNR